MDFNRYFHTQLVTVFSAKPSPPVIDSEPDYDFDTINVRNVM